MKKSPCLKRILIAAALVGSSVGLAQAWPAAAQEAISLIIHNVEAQYSPGRGGYDVQAVIGVIDAEGMPIADLKASEFTVRQDGSDVEGFELEPATGGIRLLLTIDTSGSMAAEGKMAAVKKACDSFVQGLGDQDQVGLISFNEQSKVEINITDDRTAVQNFVELLQPRQGAGTCLWDAAYEAVQVASAMEHGRRGVILLTDGVDELLGGGTCSRKTLEDVIGLATDPTIRVPVYTVGVGRRVNEQDLARVADLTGGRFFLAASAASVGDLFSDLGLQLRSGYALRYWSSTASGEHSLFVQVDHEGKRDQDTRRFLAPELPDQVAFVGLENGQHLSADTTFGVEVRGQVDAARVEFFADDTSLGADEQAPYEGQLSIAGLTPGGHILRAVAYAPDGSPIAEGEVQVIREPEVAGPSRVTVRFEGISPGQTIMDPITVRVVVDGAGGVEKVVFFIDNEVAGEDSTPPYETLLSPSALEAGEREISAVAFAAGGQEIGRESIRIVLERPFPMAVLAGMSLGVLALGAAVLVVRSRRRKPAVGAAAAPLVAPAAPAAAEAAKEAASAVKGGTLAVIIIEDCQDTELIGQRFEIWEPEVTIGRSESSSIVIPIQPVSREHAVIEITGRQDAGMTMDQIVLGEGIEGATSTRERFVIFDGNPQTAKPSTFGTFVDEVQVPPEGLDLKDGCCIRLGRLASEGRMAPVILRFQDLRPAPTPARPPVQEAGVMTTLVEPKEAAPGEAATEALEWEAGPTVVRGRRKDDSYETEDFGIIPPEEGPEAKG